MQILAHDAGLPVSRACDALGCSRATLYRRRRPPNRVPPKCRHVARRIPDPERQRILKVLDAPENVDQPPAEIYARLLSAGIYLASVRTLYRILAERNEVRERRRGHVVRRHEVPRLCATGPNQVWTWDITKVPGSERGTFFYLYVILDLFSRYIVGWLAAERENARLASSLIAETAARHAIAPDALTVHSDRGAPMTAGSMTQLLATLQIEQSFSRPRVSDDNAFVESAFKTVKYQPDYPGRFGSLLHLRAWFGELADWYCNHHHHAGIALFTPADVFHSRVATVAAMRQRALDHAYAANPRRFVHGPPRLPLPPASVSINPIQDNRPILRPVNFSPTPVRSSPECTQRDSAQAGSRAAKPASEASEPLTRLSTVADSDQAVERHAKPRQTLTD